MRLDEQRSQVLITVTTTPNVDEAGGEEAHAFTDVQDAVCAVRAFCEAFVSGTRG